MSYADEVYNTLIKTVHEQGVWDVGEDVRTKYADGTPAYSKSIFGYQVKFPKGVVPIITTKKVFTQTALKEMILIWVKQTNVVKDFQDWNVRIWDEWEKPDGTIGNSYGKQFQKGDRNQVQELIHNIKTAPKSRRLMTSFWDFENVQDKALQECAWATQWDVRNGQLNLILIQRSVDSALGILFNWFQYYALQCAIAQVCGLEVGEFTHQMGNVHYYDRHENLLLEQIEEQQYDNSNCKVEINKELTNFFDLNLDDIKLLDYNCSSKIFKYEIAI